MSEYHEGEVYGEADEGGNVTGPFTVETSKVSEQGPDDGEDKRGQREDRNGDDDAIRGPEGRVKADELDPRRR